MQLNLLFPLADMISAAVWPPFIFGLVIGFPSALLYFGQLCVILGNWKHFHSSYFILFSLRAGISLANFFPSYIAHRLGRLGLIHSLLADYFPSWALALGTFLMYYSFHLENLTTALLLLNRLSSVLFPMRYEEFWRIFLPIAFFITIFCPLPFTLPVFWLQWFVQLDIERTPFAGNNFSFTLNNNVPKDYALPRTFLWSYTTICAYSGGAFLVVSLLLNLMTLRAFMRTKTSHNENGQQQKMERKLTIHTLITFGGQLLFSLYMILMRSRYIEPDHDKQERLYVAIFNQYGWVSDFCTIALPSWSLLWANKKSRDLLYCKFWPKACKNLTTTAPMVVNGMNSWAHRTEASQRLDGRRATTTVFHQQNTTRA